MSTLLNTKTWIAVLAATFSLAGCSTEQPQNTSELDEDTLATDSGKEDGVTYPLSQVPGYSATHAPPAASQGLFSAHL